MEFIRLIFYAGKMNYLPGNSLLSLTRNQQIQIRLLRIPLYMVVGLFLKHLKFQ